MSGETTVPSSGAGPTGQPSAVDFVSSLSHDDGSAQDPSTAFEPFLPDNNVFHESSALDLRKTTSRRLSAPSPNSIAESKPTKGEEEEEQRTEPEQPVSESNSTIEEIQVKIPTSELTESSFPPFGVLRKHGLGPNVKVHHRSQIHKMAYIGPNSYIHKDAVLEARAYIGPNCQIWPGSIVGRGAKIGPNGVLRGAHVYPNATLGPNVVLEKKSIIGDGALIESNVKVQAGAVVESGATVGCNTTIAKGAVVAKGAIVPPNSKVKKNQVFSWEDSHQSV